MNMEVLNMKGFKFCSVKRNSDDPETQGLSGRAAETADEAVRGSKQGEG